MKQDRQPTGIRAGGEYRTMPQSEQKATVPSPSTWSAHGTEARPWKTNPNALSSEGRQPNADDRNLTSIHVSIPPRIAAVNPPASSETGAAVAEATAAIAALDQKSRGALSGIASLLLRTEAVASSRIERVYASRDDYVKASAGPSTSSAATSTLAATKALTQMIEQVDEDRKVTLCQLLGAHQILMADSLTDRDYAGRIRDMQNWIGGPSETTPRGAIHIPPPPELVPGLLGDLMMFSNRADMPAVTQAALAHAQFESIHPFTDGNGRIGRGLVGSVLRYRALTTCAIVPVASAMLADTAKYFDKVTEYRDGASDEFVLYFARSATVAALASRDTAARLQKLPDQWRSAVSPRRGSSVDTLITKLVSAPILNLESATAITGTAASKTYAALDRLTAAGVLYEATQGGRNRVWAAADVLDELDRLTETIGVRTATSR